MDRMKKGIRCNEVRFTNGDKRDRIRFEFVSDDGNTPSSCTVCVGDIDPMTGEKITDVTFFREYYRMVDHQVRENLKAERRKQTPEEIEQKEKEKETYIRTFVKQWGYAPSRDDVLYHLEQMEKEGYHLSAMVFEDDETGENIIDRQSEFCVEMEEEESPQLQALHEVERELTGRKAEVFEAMLQRAAGGKERLRFSAIARKWGVAPKQITKDQERIVEMVRQRAKKITDEFGIPYR